MAAGASSWAADPVTIERLRGASADKIMRELAEKFGTAMGSLGSSSAILEQAAAERLLDEWWRTADDLKQRGLYVDYVNKSWKTPGELGEADYRDALERAEPVLEMLGTVANGVLEMSVEAPQFLKWGYRAYVGSLPRVTSPVRFLDWRFIVRRLLGVTRVLPYRDRDG